jgi:hypothetical protein
MDETSKDCYKQGARTGGFWPYVEQSFGEFRRERRPGMPGEASTDDEQMVSAGHGQFDANPGDPG